MGSEAPADVEAAAQPWAQQLGSLFVLEDPRLTKAAEAALSTFAVLDATQPELPVLFARGRCWGELCTAKEGVVGVPLGAALQLAPASLHHLAAALEGAAPVCLRLEAGKLGGGKPLQTAFEPVYDAASAQLRYWVASLELARAAAGGGQAGAAAAQESEDAGAEAGAEEASAQAPLPDVVPAALLLSAPEGSGPWAVAAVSNHFVELTGWAAANLTSAAGWHKLVGPDTEGEVVARVDAAIGGSVPGGWLLLLYRKDGSCLWCYFYACPLPGGLQLCIVVDVTATRLRRVGAYSMGRVIGQGTYGIVRIGCHRDTGELVALKLVDNRALRHLDELQQLQDEMAVLSSLRHPRIIRFFGTVQSAASTVFVMEYAPGGSLKDYLNQQENRVVSEAQARHFFEQCVAALDYCHRRRVVHRDLKPENILLDVHGDIKIADFGLAGITTPFDENLSDTCGTLEFTAPEVLTRQEYNGAAADMWSLGAVVYELLAGHSPFKAATPAAVIKAACRGVYEPLPDTISAQCRDLLAGLLTVNPAARMTMEQVVCHPWLLGALPQAGGEEPAGAACADCVSAGREQFFSCACSLEGSSQGSFLDALSIDSFSSGGSGGASGATRHNSLRLVVPGATEELLPAVPEDTEGEGEAAAGGGSTTPATKASSPRRSVTMQPLATASVARRSRTSVLIKSPGHSNRASRSNSAVSEGAGAAAVGRQQQRA